MQAWVGPHPRRIPTAEEVRGILREVEELDGELKTLRGQILFLERRVSDLQDKRAKRVSFISPYRRLPQELLIKIATIYIDEGGSPHTLNRVSSSMREAVNSIKSLWGTIHIVPYRSGKRHVTDDEESHGRLSRRGKVRDPQHAQRRTQKVCLTYV